MQAEAQFSRLMAVLVLIAVTFGASGCSVVGFAASVGCEVVTAGTVSDDCYELGQSIANSGD